ncbi:hypothetical protein ACO2Q8_12650 [Larkinella sp. VNQ87]|uniref:hypothetical protein n=1 Tax=Larkinella sp. VNQ87 TaxID=3400921 RepID=UPI003BFD2072
MRFFRKKPFQRCIHGLVGWLLVGLISCQVEPVDPPVDPSTVPTDAARGIVSLFDTYQTVALSELHYNQEIWDIVEQVLDHPDFQRKVRTIAFEGGNSLYQSLMDAYTQGGEVSEAEIKQVWRNNTQVNTTYDAPVYLRMINHVRSLNQDLPHDQQIRILLLDPPIDWALVQGPTDYLPFLTERESSMVQVLEKEVYQANQNVLFVAGGPHVERSKADSRTKSALTQLEESHPGTTFTVAFYSGFGVEEEELPTVENLFATWPKPGIGLLADTPIGELPASINTAAKGPDGQLIDLYPGMQLEEIFDAIIYAGKRAELSTSSPSLGVCTGKPEDDEWKTVLLQRQVLVDVPPPLRATPESICEPLPARYFDQAIFK